MRILSWNVNGIRAAARKGFAEWLKNENPDILGIQETKAHPDQLDEELKNIGEYKSYWSSAEKKGYSGVALYAKMEPENIEYGIGIDRFDSEGRTIIATFQDFILYNIYFPNGKSRDERLQYKMDFYKAFQEEVLARKKRENKDIIICGDVNTAHKEIDLARPKENSDVSGFLPMERKWIDKFLSSGFLDTFREFSEEPDRYSWWSYRIGARERNVGWRIDYFYINNEFRPKLKDAFILDSVEGSDHCPIGIEI